MNCVNCFHYTACQSVDVTGYVADREKPSEEACEHFITPADVNPTAHWYRKVKMYKHSPLGELYINYHCSHCHNTPRSTIKSFKIKDWDNYWADHYIPEELPAYCVSCGAKMNLEETNHENLMC
jgi:hypothetical protein